MRLQLYMWGPLRATFLRRHIFYVEQAKTRILSQFQNIEAEAEQFADAEYDRIGQETDFHEVDNSEVAEAANDRAQEFYGLLNDLKQQTLLGTLAGLYHQWDKELRDFIDRELQKEGVKSDFTKKKIWQPEIGSVFDILSEFGWDCRSAPFFSDLDACRLVVNVYKHGKGRSLDELAVKYPEFINDGLMGMGRAILPAYLDHEWLTVTEEHFDKFSTAIDSFWRAFPERLFYQVPV